MFLMKSGLQERNKPAVTTIILSRGKNHVIPKQLHPTLIIDIWNTRQRFRYNFSRTWQLYNNCMTYLQSTVISIAQSPVLKIL